MRLAVAALQSTRSHDRVHLREAVGESLSVAQARGAILRLSHAERYFCLATAMVPRTCAREGGAGSGGAESEDGPRVRCLGHTVLHQLVQREGATPPPVLPPLPSALTTIQMGRDPTNVEIFDLSQSNSEHSRHWFFRGKFVSLGTSLVGADSALIG